MKRSIILGFIIMSIITPNVIAQPYMKAKTQHRFAQTYIGFNTQFIPSSGSIVIDNQSTPFPWMAIPRFTIGGLHFWGHLDFNVNFPLVTLSDSKIDDMHNIAFSTGGDLSARYYPWRIQYGSLRPFMGISSNVMEVTLEKEKAGDRSVAFIANSLLGGLSYASKEWQVNAEVMWLPNRTRTFYSSRTDRESYRLPGAYFSLGLVKYFDTTLKEEKRKVSGETARLERQLLREGKLNSLSLAIAPSAAFFLLEPGFKDPTRRSLPRHTVNFVWEFGLGYLFHKAGIHVGLNYRDFTSEVESFNFNHLLRRRSLALEAYKFFWDYNGFVPFIGPTISLERWATGEFEGNTQIGNTQRTTMISPGVIAGWDILASPLETWVLRTNLRYYPFQRVKQTDGKRSRVDQFEFNFIQVVFYPQRYFAIKKARS